MFTKNVTCHSLMKKQQKSKDLYKNLKLLKKSYFTFFTICVLLNLFILFYILHYLCFTKCIYEKFN